MPYSSHLIALIQDERLVELSLLPIWLSRSVVHSFRNPSLYIGLLVSSVRTSSDVRRALARGMKRERALVPNTTNAIALANLHGEKSKYRAYRLAQTGTLANLCKLLGPRPSPRRYRVFVHAVIVSGNAKLLLQVVNGGLLQWCKLSRKKCDRLLCLTRDEYELIASYYDFPIVREVLRRVKAI